ncbi:MAG TPA: hypothetical protein VN914_00310 [Polyangia bacterium]|jgi:hypothetical protein|nr:hypothetical protein [Polyangia bacterium]
MHITARLDEATIAQLLGELLPAQILLDDQGEKGRWIRIEQPRQVDFIADRGLRLQTSGQIQWLAAGLPITVTLNSVQVMLEPQVVEEPAGGRLVFHTSLEDLDLKNVPGFLDRGLLGIINGKLESQGNALAWHFGKSLTVNADLPGSIVPPEAFQMSVRNARVAVLADALELTVGFDMRFSRAGK